jgi:predicted RNA methylase
MDETLKIFTAYDIQACLYDADRVDLFQRAITSVVKRGATVVDGGSGTGLLGLLAAKAGAARVYCLEINAEYVEIIRENARRNGLADRIIAVHADATKWRSPDPVDVIVSEVISAGFFYEPQLQIIDNLRLSLKPKGHIIPLSMANSVELIDAQTTLYGLRFDYDSRYRALAEDHSLTTAVQYLSTNFHQKSDPKIHAAVSVRGTSTGTANAVRIGYSIEFTKGAWADKPTEFLMNPQIIFLAEPIAIVPEHEYRVTLSYQASDSPNTAKIVITPQPVVGTPADGAVAVRRAGRKGLATVTTSGPV